MPGESGAAGQRGSCSRISSLLRKIAGMPDYDAHVEHLRRCHAQQPIPTRREFYEAFICARYADGPTRCC
jgi:uncharacterized short protein YbdD (DUF466 family)